MNIFIESHLFQVYWAERDESALCSRHCRIPQSGARSNDMNKSKFLFSGGGLKHSARGGVRGRGVVRGGRGAPIIRGAINIRGAAMAARGFLWEEAERWEISHDRWHLGLQPVFALSSRLSLTFIFCRSAIIFHNGVVLTKSFISTGLPEESVEGSWPDWTTDIEYVTKYKVFLIGLDLTRKHL